MVRQERNVLNIFVGQWEKKWRCQFDIFKNGKTDVRKVVKDQKNNMQQKCIILDCRMTIRKLLLCNLWKENKYKRNKLINKYLNKIKI